MCDFQTGIQLFGTFFKKSPLCELITNVMKKGGGKDKFNPVLGGARHAIVRLYNPVPERKTDYYNYE